MPIDHKDLIFESKFNRKLLVDLFFYYLLNNLFDISNVRKYGRISQVKVALYSKRSRAHHRRQSLVGFERERW